jgi:hypothetical protein
MKIMETAKDIAERFYQLNKNYHGDEWVEGLEKAILEKAIEEYAEAKSGQVDAVVMLRKSLVDEIERFNEILEDEDSTLYRGMRSGLQKALDLLDMRTAT